MNNLDLGVQLVAYFWLSIIALALIAGIILTVVEVKAKYKVYKEKKRMTKFKIISGGK